jgi:hypothetical protein
MIPSGMVQRDEREQTADEVSKAYRRCRNRGEVVAPGQVWGNFLIAAQMASGIKAQGRSSLY